MKSPRKLIRTSDAIFLSGPFTAAALAGPGPQYSKPSCREVGYEIRDCAEAPVAGKCDGCKTTPI